LASLSGKPVEIREEIDLILGRLLFGFAAAQKVVDQDLWVHLFLNVERRRVVVTKTSDQVRASVLCVRAYWIMCAGSSPRLAARGI